MSGLDWAGIWSIIENSRNLSDVDTFDLIPRIKSFYDAPINGVIPHQIQRPNTEGEDMTAFAMRCVYNQPEVEPTWSNLDEGSDFPTLSLTFDSDKFKFDEYGTLSGKTVPDIANQLTDEFISTIVENRQPWYWDFEANGDIFDGYNDNMENFLMEMIRGGTALAMTTRRGPGNYIIIHRKYWDELLEARMNYNEDNSSRLTVLEVDGYVKTEWNEKHIYTIGEDGLELDEDDMLEKIKALAVKKALDEMNFNLTKVAKFNSWVDVYVYDGELDNFMFINGYQGSGVSDAGLVMTTHSVSNTDDELTFKYRLARIDGFEKYYSVGVYE